MAKTIDRIKARRVPVEGACPFNQTLCAKIADARPNGDALSDCPLCKPYAIGKSKPNYPVPAIRQCYCGYTLQQHRDELPCDYLGFLNYG